MSNIIPYSVIDDYTLSVIKAPPVVEILAGRLQDDNVLNYNLMGHVFQFSYRYIYFDGERSVWSMPTHVVLPFLYGNNIYEMVLEQGVTEHIVIQLRLFIIPTDVYKIEIAMRQDGGAWYYYDSIKITSAGYTNGYMDYNFINDLIPIQLPDGEITIPYDFVPRKAKSQEVINKNIISYGNILEGYTNPRVIDVELTANVIYTEVFHNSLFTGVYSPYVITNVIFHGHVTDRPGNVVDIEWGDDLDGLLTNFVVYLISEGTYHKVVYNRVENWDATSFTDLMEAIEEDEWVTNVAGAGLGNVMRITFIPELEDPGAIGIGYRNYGFVPTLKDYAKYYVGIEYLDKFGRIGTVVKNDDMIVDIPSLGGQALAYNDYISYITYQINHTPPKWAHSWRFCYATNIIWWMQYLIRPYHDIDRSVFRDKERALIKIKINQGINDVRDELPNYALDNYVWEKGDRIRIIGTVPVREWDVTHFPVEVIDTSTGGWGTGRELDYEILGFDGVYIYITDFTQDDFGTYIYADVPDIDSPDADDIFVEIYRIRKDTENLIYKSIPLNTEKTEGDIVEDYDGNVYTTIVIGNREWMVENLRTTHYQDGTAIPNLTVNGDWTAENGTPGHDGAYCWYNNNIANKATYGALYNGYALINPHGLAPKGWRLATDNDYYYGIIEYLASGNTLIAGGKIKEAGIVHWNTPNTGATDEVGFCGVPGGRRNNVGVFSDIQDYGYHGTIIGALYYFRLLEYDNMAFRYSSNSLKYGFSVRCVRDFDPMGAYGITNPGTSSRAHADPEGTIQLWNSRLCMLPMANLVADREREITASEPTTTSTTSSTSTTSTGAYDLPFAPGLKCCVANIPYWGHKINILFDQLWDSKLNIYDPNFKEERINKIRWGGEYIDDSQVNNLCRFLYRDEKRMPDKYGDIFGMREVGYTLKVLQQSKNTSIYIGREMALDASGNTQMVYTDSTLGSISPAIEEFGTVFNDSIVVSDRWMYFFDIYSGRVIRDAPNGMVDIGFGQHKMQTYFRQKADALLLSGVENVNVIGGVDRENNMVYFTFLDSITPANNETIGFHEATGRWKSFFSFVPECYGKLGENTFFSFKSGRPYIHNSSVPNRCTFYATKYSQELWLVSSINPQVNKQYNSITIVSNRLWTLPDNDSILISPTVTYPNGMASKLRAGDFEEYEGEFRAAFLGDLLTAGAANDYYLYNGRELRGRELLMKLENQENGEVNLFIVKVNSSISR